MHTYKFFCVCVSPSTPSPCVCVRFYGNDALRNIKINSNHILYLVRIKAIVHPHNDFHGPSLHCHTARDNITHTHTLIYCVFDIQRLTKRASLCGVTHIQKW